MYDVDEGEIRVDGTDIDGVTLSSLRQAIGYVSQESYLFYGTIEENIAYGTFDASDEEIVEAAKAAEAHEFITNLPEGYDTMAGERGVKLSGGQRQRITIARAILSDPEIMILDEATSDVDTETEMLIQRSLDRLTEDRTTFSIAHRLSTIKDADQIVVLEDGRVARTRHPRGPHRYWGPLRQSLGGSSRGDRRTPRGVHRARDAAPGPDRRKQRRLIRATCLRRPTRRRRVPRRYRSNRGRSSSRGRWRPRRPCS